MFCMMVQPGVFEEYLKKHNTSGRNSGFLARFLMARVDHTATIAFNNKDPDWLKSSLDKFNNRVRTLLEEAKRRFHYGISDRKQLKLSLQAASFMGEKRYKMKQLISEGGEWEHIRDIALKSGANALRLATIFHHFNGEDSEEISLAEIESAYTIIEWYMQQASAIFFHDSKLYQFREDVLEVYYWIYNKMAQNGMPVIEKSELLKRGPNRLRSANMVNRILGQLYWQRKICLYQNIAGGTVYINLPNRLGVFEGLSNFTNQFYSGYVEIMPEMKTSEFIELDLPNLVFIP